jgi:L-cysteine:1D-myo-inositol 2-amino-2-deoxy-alpha-D-glucopyranoside ligase
MRSARRLASPQGLATEGLILVLRLALMFSHYRRGFEWHHSMLEPARELLCKLRSAIAGEAGADPRPYVAEVRAALDDDLDAPRAVTAVAGLAESINRGGSDQTAVEGLRTCCALLGLDVSATNDRV